MCAQATQASPSSDAGHPVKGTLGCSNRPISFARLGRLAPSLGASALGALRSGGRLGDFDRAVAWSPADVPGVSTPGRHEVTTKGCPGCRRLGQSFAGGRPTAEAHEEVGPLRPLTQRRPAGSAVRCPVTWFNSLWCCTEGQRLPSRPAAFRVRLLEKRSFVDLES